MAHKRKAEVGASGKMDFKSIFAKRKKSGAEYGIVEVEDSLCSFVKHSPQRSCTANQTRIPALIISVFVIVLLQIHIIFAEIQTD